MARFLMPEAREDSSERLSEERVEGSTSGSDASLSEEIPLSPPRKKRPESRATFPRHASNDDRQDVLKAIRKSNRLLSDLVDRVDKTERSLRLKLVEKKIDASNVDSTPSSSRRRSTKRDVPGEVRRETRRVYSLLMEEDLDNFDGWKIEPGITYRDPHNQAILNRLVREVKGINSTFLTEHIKDAAYRFYRSRSEENSARRRGKLEGKNKTKRRHERLVRKFKERKAAFEKTHLALEGGKEKWKSIITIDIMSSDESGNDDDKEVIVSHPLPWLSSNVALFKNKLDEAGLKTKSPQARRQMKDRVQGCPSLRPQPEGETLPSWVFKN